MRNVSRFTFCAILFALFLIQPVLGDIIPTEGAWDDEYYRSVNTNRPPVVSIEGDILSLSFEDALSNLTVCVMNDKGVKVYEDVVSSEAGGTCIAVRLVSRTTITVYATAITERPWS